MSEMRIQHTEVKEQLMEMKISNVEIQKTLGTQDKELYVAKQKQKSEQECKMQLTKNINKFCEQVQIEVENNVTENSEKLEEMLSKQLKLKQCEITELAENNEQSDKIRQLKIDELRTEITKSEQSLKTQEKQKLMSEKSGFHNSSSSDESVYISYVFISNWNKCKIAVANKTNCAIYN